MRYKNFFYFTILFSSLIGYGQFEYGVKGGIQMPASGTIMDAAKDLSSMSTINANRSGYFIGSYVSLDILLFYLRPELQFSYLNRDFESFSLSQSRIEAPVSLGFKLLPVLSVFAGPTFQYNFEPTVQDFSFSSLEEKTTLGIHMGVRAHLGALHFDVRFDRGLSPNEVQLIEQNGMPTFGRIDTRPNVWSLGLSYRFD